MKKYQIIYADPPWQQRMSGAKNVRPNSSGKAFVYPTITLQEIKQHLFNAVLETTPDSVMFLWTIDKYLHEAETIGKELGYKLHARMIWDKVTGIAAAYTVRYGHEYLLYCYRGKFTPVAKDARGKYHTVFREQVKRHSQKPEIAYQIIETLYPNTHKLELYARNKRRGWDCWGNEVESDIELC